MIVTRWPNATTSTLVGSGRGNARGDVLHWLSSEGFPRRVRSLLRDFFDRLRLRLFPFLLEIVFERGFISLHDFFEHFGRGDARQIGSARCRRERQAEADQIVSRVADHSLIEVPDLDFDVFCRTGDRSEVAEVDNRRKSRSADLPVASRF